MMFPLFVSCSKGLEYLLADELQTLGFEQLAVSPNGVLGQATLVTVYRVCLWSRLANRVQWVLFEGEAQTAEQLYALCHGFAWETIFSADKTFAVQFHGTSLALRNTMFGAQVVKDAVVDCFRDKTGQRPGVDRESPQVLLHAYLKKDSVSVRFDLTGYSLHQRGYRLEAGSAPLKETVAAAVLMRAGWPLMMDERCVLHDPCCGSGTLVIEAAMMAARMAPGLLRHDQAFSSWVHHDAELWASLRNEALQQRRPLPYPLYGTDQDPSVIRIARANAERAGVAPWVSFEVLPVSHAMPSDAQRGLTGLLVSNPPYGERMEDEASLMPLYQALGKALHTHYQGWQAAILTSSPVLAKAIGLRSHRQHALFNGPLACKLYGFEVSSEQTLRDPTYRKVSDAANMFANRLKKNQAHLQKWAARNNISCYRVYDADLPEYAFAIDCYGEHVVLQEYIAPASISVELALQRRRDVIHMVPQVLGIPEHQVVVKERKPQKGMHQYQKLNQTQRFIKVSEGRAVFHVNLHDYLDTGLFLDHRLLRLRFGELKPGSRFLNCFCYTGTASVHAALAGALTTNVDLSQTYLTWAEDNFKINGLNPSKHQFIHADCLTWMHESRDRFDVIFLDPPSFSNSKRMSDVLDIQRDHVALIHDAMRLLNANGVLYFSTNLRTFKLAPELQESCTVRDITAQTIDLDFKRRARIHQCFEIRV